MLSSATTKGENHGDHYTYINTGVLTGLNKGASNWSELFEKKYGAEIKGNKDVRTEWMVKLGAIRNIVDHRYCVSEEQSEYVRQIHNWIVRDES